MVTHTLVCLLTVFIYMSIWFFVSLKTERNDIADIAWGGGFIVVCAAALFLSRSYTLRSLLAAAMTIAWAVRLMVYVSTKKKGKAEDPRYRSWRDSWGKLFYVRSFFQIYLLQGLLIVIVAAPVLYVLLTSARAPVGWIEITGILLWITGFAFESIGDLQLLQFKRRRVAKDEVLMTGLWKYSRHPNYFGEVLLWWGLFLLAVRLPYGFVTVIGPVAITVLILFVSGIPMLEKQLEKNARYREYQAVTSCFFPLPFYVRKGKNEVRE